MSTRQMFMFYRPRKSPDFGSGLTTSITNGAYATGTPSTLYNTLVGYHNGFYTELGGNPTYGTLGTGGSTCYFSTKSGTLAEIHTIATTPPKGGADRYDLQITLTTGDYTNSGLFTSLKITQSSTLMTLTRASAFSATYDGTSYTTIVWRNVDYLLGNGLTTTIQFVV